MATVVESHGLGRRFGEVVAVEEVSFAVEQGEFFTEGDVLSASRVVVLGKTVADRLFPGLDPVGQTIRVRNLTFRVAGVLAPKGQSMVGQDQDDTAVIPYTTVQKKLLGQVIPSINQAMISAISPEASGVVERQIAETRALLRDLPAGRAEHRYAAGKWSVAEVVGHLADAERVFSYRALRIARGDETPLPGFDENAYVPAGRFDRRPIADVVDEFTAVRHATLALLRGLPEDTLTRTGTASGYAVSARALAWIIAGHELHHRAVLRERYGVG